MKEPLFLFDIDGTLVQGFELHRQAFIAALTMVYKVNPWPQKEQFNFHGMTDQQIIRELLKKIGKTEDEINLNLNKCLNFMSDYYGTNITSAEIKVLPGVIDLLETLNSMAVLGLVTGNLIEIARSKIKTTKLRDYFLLDDPLIFGGFGSDGMVRSSLIKIAIKRISELTACDFNDIYIVGDTPRDIQAGQIAGVKTIGIASGVYSLDELAIFAPNHLFENANEMLESLGKIILK